MLQNFLKMLKLLSIYLVLIVLNYTPQFATADADKIEQFAFGVDYYTGFSQGEVNQIVSDAEHAKAVNGANLKGIARTLRDSMEVRYGRYYNVVVNYGPVSAAYNHDKYQIYLRSNSDNMQILCYRTLTP